jgi:hypothetical protein
MGSKYFLRTDLEVSRDFLFNRFETDQRCLEDSKNSFENKTQNQTNHVYFGFHKIAYGLFSKPLISGIFSVIGKFIEDYLKILTCWEKYKYAVVISSSKSIKKVVEVR